VEGRASADGPDEFTSKADEECSESSFYVLGFRCTASARLRHLTSCHRRRWRAGTGTAMALLRRPTRTGPAQRRMTCARADRQIAAHAATSPPPPGRPATRRRLSGRAATLSTEKQFDLSLDPNAGRDTTTNLPRDI